MTDVGPGHDPAADQLLARLRHELPRPSRWLLLIVIVLALIQLVVVLPWLVGRDPLGLLSSSGVGHLTRDGGLGLVVAVAGLLAAWRPRWALPMFLLASLALVAQAVAGLFDSAANGVEDGSAVPTSELIHVPSVILTCLIGLMAVPLRSLGRARSGPVSVDAADGTT